MKWSDAGRVLSSYTAFTGIYIAGNNVYVRENNHLNADKYGDAQITTDMKIGVNIDGINLLIRKRETVCFTGESKLLNNSNVSVLHKPNNTFIN